MSSKSEDDSLPATLWALKMEEEAKSPGTTMVFRSFKKNNGSNLDAHQQMNG